VLKNPPKKSPLVEELWAAEMGLGSAPFYFATFQKEGRRREGGTGARKE